MGYIVIQIRKVMIVHIIQDREIIEISLSTIPLVPSKGAKSFEDKYYKSRDEKWRKFCKEHHFHPHKDANGKIYRLYLQLCAEGII